MRYCDHFSFVVRPSVRPPVNIFKRPPLKSLSQCCSNFIWSLLRVEKRKIAKMVEVRWPRWLPRPYMVKPFKDLLLQNRECLRAEPLHESLGTGGLPKSLKELSYVDVWPFYGKSSLLPYAFVWEKPLKIFFFKTEHALWGLPKIMVIHWHLTFLRQGQVCFFMHLYGKKHLKILFSKTEDGLWLNLCIYHLERAVYQSC